MAKSRWIYQQNPDIVAIDSNVFITLAKISTDFVKKKNRGAEFTEKIRIMKRKCVGKTLKFVILPSVLKEIYPTLSKKEAAFLNEYCLILDPKDKKRFAKMSYELAETYCDAGVMKSKDGKPTMDAIIMAEATISGLNLVTNNSRDFLSYEKAEMKQRTDKKDKSPRATDIAKLNKKLGYVYETKKLEKFTPKPFSSSQYVNWYKDTGAFGMREDYPGIEFIGG